MLRKFLALILAITATTLAACGEKKEQASPPAQPAPAVQQVRTEVNAQQYVDEITLIESQLKQKLELAGEAAPSNPGLVLEDVSSAVEDTAYAMAAVTSPVSVADLHTQRVRLWQDYGSELDGDSFADVTEFKDRNTQVVEQDAHLAAQIDDKIDKD